MIEATPFTPLTAAAGGALIGLSAVMLMLGLGKIAGISGLLRAITTADDPQKHWKLAFLAGLVAAAWAVYHLTPFNFVPREAFPLWKLVVAGLLVGAGTAMGSGCTSGHGVCGIARLSKRSIIATAVFMAFGIITAVVVRQVIEVAS